MNSTLIYIQWRVWSANERLDLLHQFEITILTTIKNACVRTIATRMMSNTKDFSVYPFQFFPELQKVGDVGFWWMVSVFNVGVHAILNSINFSCNIQHQTKKTVSEMACLCPRCLVHDAHHFSRRGICQDLVAFVQALDRLIHMILYMSVLHPNISCKYIRSATAQRVSFFWLRCCCVCRTRVLLWSVSDIHRPPQTSA